MTQPVLTKYKQGDLPQDYVKKADRMKTINLDAEADPNEAEQINLNTTRNDFVKFINEYDKRRGKSFKKVFPELEEFYESCL